MLLGKSFFAAKESPNEDPHTEVVDSLAIYDSYDDEFEPICFPEQLFSEPTSSNSILEGELAMNVVEKVPEAFLVQKHNTQPIRDKYDDELEEEW